MNFTPAGHLASGTWLAPGPRPARGGGERDDDLPDGAVTGCGRQYP